MDMRVPIRDLTVRLDAGYHAGHDTVAIEHGTVDFEHRFPGEAGQLA